MTSYLTAASYLVRLAGEGEEGDPLTPMRLHKLLFYVQGWALVSLGRPLFSGRFEAWIHGPVLRELYPRFAGSDSPVKADQFGDLEAPIASERALIEAVWNRYGQFSASKLRQMTHEEAPWRDARFGLEDTEGCSEEITQEAMVAFFALQADSGSSMGLKPADAYAALDEIERGEGLPSGEVFARLRERRCHTH